MSTGFQSSRIVELSNYTLNGTDVPAIVIKEGFLFFGVELIFAKDIGLVSFVRYEGSIMEWSES